MNGGPLSGAVLDLRNNPGGILSGAVSVADAFLDDGLIVYTEGRNPDSREEYYAKPSDFLRRRAHRRPRERRDPRQRPRSSPAPSRTAGGR